MEKEETPIALWQTLLQKSPFSMQSKLPTHLLLHEGAAGMILPQAKHSVRCFRLGCASQIVQSENLEHTTALGVCRSTLCQEKEWVLTWGCSLTWLLSPEVSTYTSHHTMCSSNFWKMDAMRIKEQFIMSFRMYFYCLDTLTQLNADR